MSSTKKRSTQSSRHTLQNLHERLSVVENRVGEFSMSLLVRELSALKRRIDLLESIELDQTSQALLENSCIDLSTEKTPPLTPLESPENQARASMELFLWRSLALGSGFSWLVWIVWTVYRGMILKP